MNSVLLLVFMLVSVALAINIHQLSSETTLASKGTAVPLLNQHGGWKFDVNFDVRLVGSCAICSRLHCVSSLSI